jgi:hypothetical protein
MTSQGNPRAVFASYRTHKNRLVAEVTARQISMVSLEEALSLVVLVAEVPPEKLDAYARRWIARLASERPVTLGGLNLAITALRALPSPRGVTALRDIVRL